MSTTPLFVITNLINLHPMKALFSQTPSPIAPANLMNLSDLDQQLDAIGGNAFAGISNLSQQMLNSVKASDDDFGIKLNQLVSVSKGLDPAKYQKKGVVNSVMSLFSNTKERMLASYNTVEQQMASLVVELDKSAQHHRGRINDYEEMYVQNYQHHEALEAEIGKGNQLKKTLEGQLEILKKDTSDSFAVQKARDMQSAIDRLDKRINDMQRGMLMSKQLAPQIRQNQDNARSLVVTFADVQMVTIPAWKNAFGLYLSQLEQKKGAALANAVYDMTDEALRKQAEAFNQNTQDIANVKARPIASIETLTYMQDQLLGAFDNLAKIEQKARDDRRASEVKLKELETQLVDRFIAKTQPAVSKA